MPLIGYSAIMHPIPENGIEQLDELLPAAPKDELTRDDTGSQASEDLTEGSTLDETIRLKALSADVQDQDELERNIGRQVRSTQQ